MWVRRVGVGEEPHVIGRAIAVCGATVFSVLDSNKEGGGKRVREKGSNAASKCPV